MMLRNEDFSLTHPAEVSKHDVKSFSSISIGHSVQMKETHNSRDHWLSAVNYLEHKWLICLAYNIQSHTLLRQNKIMLLPLRIKLGVMKNFVKAMNREGSGFAFCLNFPWINMEKLKACIIDDPQMRELMKDLMFDESLSEVKLSTWQ